MRHVGSDAWKPTLGDEDNKSSRARITFHSLDNLVWEFELTSCLSQDDVTFADLYLFYVRCPILAYKRTHSTIGNESKQRQTDRYNGTGRNGNARPGYQ